MSKTYLNSDVQSNIVDIKDSYIEKHTEKHLPVFYEPLPLEYDVFSELNIQKIHALATQKMFLDAILSELRSELQEVFMQYGTIKELPKLHITNDTDNAIILNWIYSNYRIYLNIEKTIEKSFYGVVLQDQEKNIHFKTGKVTYDNYRSIIPKILDFLFNQT